LELVPFGRNGNISSVVDNQAVVYSSQSSINSSSSFGSSTFSFDFGSLILDFINPSSNLILYRFFILHFALSFILLFLVLIHILLLHTYSSSSSLFNLSSSIYTSFILFIVKDFLIFYIIYLLCLIYTLLFNFEFLSNPVNNILANNLSTPLHILPESYFLLFYCILRAIPNKFLGVIGTLCLLY
jgi:quinol-cytochrome oxidoreductase complex cytochrome b subunit